MAETNGISYTTLLPYQNGRVSEFIPNENNGNGTGRFDENRKEGRKNGDNDSGIDEKIGNLWHMHKRTAKRVELAKRKARSELQKCGWQSMGFAHESIGHALNPDWQAQFDTIQRVDASEMTYEQFVEQFERSGIPVILTGLTSGWRANERWDFKDLRRGYRNQKFKCGEDDDGYSVKLKMKYYLDYMFGQGMGPNMDDSPLYIFDSGFGDRPKTAKMLSDYEVPPMFKDDLFRYASEKRRPPYRWFVMGPTRSGTGIHIDPLGTSAWNALIKGHKKWCLIDPRAPKHLVKPERKEAGDHPDEAVAWFSTVDRRIMEKDPAKWPYYLYTVIHAIQRPGDIMFVPSGWWHVVMNLDHTVAVTQNFCSITNLHKVWPKTMKSRPQLALHWLKALKRERPELIPRIEEINQKNGLKSLDIREPCDSSSSSSSESDESSSESDDGETVNGNWNEMREGERPQNDGNFDITKMRDVDHRPFPPSLQFLHEQFRQTEKNRKNEQQNVPNNSMGEGNRKRKLGHCEGRNKSASPPAAYRHNNPKQQQNPI